MSNVKQNTGGNTLKVHGGGVFGSAAAATSSLMLADFETAIYQVNPALPNLWERDLWNQYPTGDISESGHRDYATLTFDTGNKIEGTRSLKMTMDTGTSVTDNPAPYLQFYPYTSSSWEFMRDMVDNNLSLGPWQTNTYNRFEFYVKTPSAITPIGGGNFNFTFGTYYSSVAAGGPTSGSPEVGGDHHYHRFDLPASRWVKCVVDHHPTHIRGNDGGLEHGNKQYPAAADSGTYNYFDLLTRVYLDMEQLNVSADGTVWNFDSFRFYQDSNTENESQVYSMQGSYVSGTNDLQIGWNRHKDENAVNHDVVYAFSDIHALGFGNATSAGAVSPGGYQGYNGMLFTSTSITMGANTSIFVAVRPVGATLFKQIEVRLDL